MNGFFSRVCFVSLFFSGLLVLPVQAMETASPSDAGRYSPDDHISDMSDGSSVDVPSDFSFDIDLSPVTDRMDYLISNLISTPSDAEREVFYEDIDDSVSMPFAAEGMPELNIDSNVIVFTGRMGSLSYPAVFGIQDADSLAVLSDGTLINTSGSPVTGRLYDAPFDTSDYDVFFITLQPYFASNSASGIYNNGGVSSYTHYYRGYSGSSYRLLSDQTFARFIVSDKYILPYEGFKRYQYLFMMVVVLFLGVIICLFLRSSKRS